MHSTGDKGRKQSPKLKSQVVDVLSDTDDEDERMDCVHDINTMMEGVDADAEQEEDTDF